MAETKDLDMTGSEGPKEILKNPSFDSYFDKVQSRKKLPMSLQETLTDAFAKISVSSFPQVPRGKGQKLCAYYFLILFLAFILHTVKD